MARNPIYRCFVMVAAVAAVYFMPAFARGQTIPMPDENMEVMASGPIHEAFAGAVVFNPEAGIVVDRQPPEMITEIPPQQKPEGAVEWIPGYWAWDDERNDYIWISGIWRVPPPGRQWVPGYWNRISSGYQWISGFWADAREEETEYLPQPPESVEIGPSSNAPSSSYIWIPGSWEWYYDRYAWRPGYWASAHPDWIWVPANYIWTPRGYIFVRGYWDHTIVRRGVLYAPVYFTPKFSFGFRYVFSPGFVLDLNMFDDALFFRPRYSHYYYGDYYAPRYYQRGIYPWFSLHARRVAYDPIYAHQRYRHRNHRDWDRNLQKTFQNRRNHEHLRPFRTYDPRKGPAKTGSTAMHQRPNFVRPVDHAGKTNFGGNRFVPMKETEKKVFEKRGHDVRAYQDERRIREAPRPSVSDRQPARTITPQREKVPRSPIINHPGQKAATLKKPPTRTREPKPNPDVEPLERRPQASPTWDRSRQRREDVRQPKANDPQSVERVREIGKKEPKPRQSDDRQPNSGNGVRRWNDR